MVLKIFRAVWFLSILGWLALFLYTYASLPEEVVVRETESRIMISREGLFYAFLGTIALLIALALAISRLYAGKEHFLIWFYGLIICLHFFLIIGINFISLINSAEKFDFVRAGYIIYGSMGLFICWAVAWPIYSVFRKILGKEAV